jgi:hypothetical protein
MTVSTPAAVRSEPFVTSRAGISPSAQATFLQASLGILIGSTCPALPKERADPLKFQTTSVGEPASRRREVLWGLRASADPLSIVAIAGELGVHPNTVRFHLDTLLGEGPVHLGLMRGAMETRGAPVAVDRLEPFVEPDPCLAHLSPQAAAR